jgi:hypothetical protein
MQKCGGKNFSKECRCSEFSFEDKAAALQCCLYAKYLMSHTPPSKATFSRIFAALTERDNASQL